MAYAAMLKFPDCCGNWPRRLACAMRAFCTIATPNSTTKNPQLRNLNNKPHHKTVRHFFLASTQPNSVFKLITIQLDGIWQKKFQMGDDKKKSKWKTTKTISKYSKLLRSLACAIWCKFHILFLHTLEDDLNGKRPWRRTTALKVRFCIFASEIFLTKIWARHPEDLDLEEFWTLWANSVYKCQNTQNSEQTQKIWA